MQFTNKQLQIILITTGLILLIWHLLILPFSPLPWYDETYFASITHSLLNGKGFALEISPLEANGKPIFYFGPVYFILTTFSSYLIGFGIFSMRIVNLLFGVFTVVVFYKTLRRLAISNKIIFVSSIFLCFDVIFLQNAHSGRMDLVALFFAFTAYYLTLDKSHKLTITATIALLLTLSFLTTPRISFLALPLGIYWSYLYIKQRLWINLLIFVTIPITLILFWIFYSYGSIVAYVDFFFKPLNGFSPVESFIGGNFNIPFFQIPTLILLLVCVWRIIKNGSSIKNLLLFLLPIFLFYGMVTDTGIYTALIIPFEYLIIAMGLNGIALNIKSENWTTKGIYGLIILVLATNIGIFCFKGVSILSNLESRNPYLISKWVKENIKPNSNIIGDDRYYYSAIDNRCNFQYYTRPENLTINNRISYFKNNFYPQYILSIRDNDSTLVKTFRESFVINRERTFIASKNITPISTLFGMTPNNISTSYDAILLNIGK